MERIIEALISFVNKISCGFIEIKTLEGDEAIRIIRQAYYSGGMTLDSYLKLEKRI